ncbi:phospho-sugar mutase [Paeniglutamicibacter kerguelensis]|uniref:Phosphomannomutase n=1 Tax=Paeniglutamicibacter kerguelensis TaxID=254788 RepID=A0ABS4X910_9MICC|nr:phospho-sugar mutase [Paeniglutamicibacter kerguelensis]MBP2384957.1 phosphomannomutase [Paeniglutamicibacter kerguelensis]
MSQNLHHTELLDRAAAWADQDPDAQTQAQLRGLCWRVRAGEAEALEELEDRFAGNLAFGTAGLRAELGAGPNRMNSMVVRRTAAGIGRFLVERAAGSYVPSAVVGFDARHNSDKFARESAAILTAAGVRVSLMPLPLPTPVLAWAVRALDAEAGIMVTASHNPPADNGYKVYLGGRVESGWGRGAQIVTPTDAQIAALIDHDEPIDAITLAESGWDVLPGGGEAGDIEAAYLSKVTALLTAPGGEATADLDAARAGLKIVLTPMHGVGGHTMSQGFAASGFTRVAIVPEQEHPDPEFPTVAFPNPEEPGAIDLAVELAKETGADLVIANDPDADRCAGAVEFPGTGWRMLRGDEVGWLLGARLAPAADPTSVFANSIVSSRMLASIAAASGLKHEQTLTGFKWISRAPHLAFGYEEALGYCVAPDLVRDKDGISAALLLAEYAAELKAAGSGFPQVLDQLALAHGLHQTDQLSVRVKDLGLLGTMMDALRGTPPQSLAGEAIVEFEDLGLGAHLPPTDGLLFLTDAGTRVIVRPSGTEPKLKCYLEVIAPVADAADLPVLRTAGRVRLESIKHELLLMLRA